jgi:hypothetical protein
MNVRLALVSAILAIALPAGARAAPQLLGVVASTDPIPMNCEGARCSAELSAFCLEQHRSGPPDATAYRPADWRALTLLATLRDGTVRRLPAAPYLQLANARAYNAVTASVADDVRDQLGASRLALMVGARTTLVPVATPGDTDPITDSEIADATLTLRVIAQDVFETGEQPELAAASVLNRLINALPRTAGGGPLDLSAPDGIWDQAVGKSAAQSSSVEGVGQAGLVYQSCRRGARFVQGLTLRRCLEASHDAIMSSLNEAYWRVVAAGN